MFFEWRDAQALILYSKNANYDRDEKIERLVEFCGGNFFLTCTIKKQDVYINYWWQFDNIMNKYC